MVNLFLRSLSLFLVSLNVLSPVHAAVIEVTTNRNPVTINESFQLLFTTTEAPDNDPDFSVLAQNFTILNQQKNSQLSWVNGVRNNTIQWQLNVMAKRSGQLMIPSVSFGDDATKPLSINVNDIVEQADSNQVDNALFLTVSIDTKQAYVQSQVLYTVRFYQRINIVQASLSEPKIDHVVIENLSDDNSPFSKVIDGVNHLVTERRYAFFPQKSGKITIPPLTLQVKTRADNAQSRSTFDRFMGMQNTKTIQITSDAVELDVLPMPDTFKNTPWLPATQVQISQSWSNDNLQTTVGEPLTRTLTLTADGITSSQLPELQYAPHSQLKTYPDQAVRIDQKSTAGITATLQQKIAIIPTQTGQIELPEHTVSWFNTQSQTMETAQLPAVTLTVIAAPNNTNTLTPTEVTSTNTHDNQEPVTLTTATASNWKWWAIFMGLGWLITLLVIFWTRHKKSNKSQSPPKHNVVNNSKNLLQQLQSACKNKDARQAKQTLTAWVKHNYSITTLTEFTQHCDATLQHEIEQLNQCLYAKTPTPWNGESLFNAVTNHQVTQARSDEKQDPLESLHLL